MLLSLPVLVRHALALPGQRIELDLPTRVQSSSHAIRQNTTRHGQVGVISPRHMKPSPAMPENIELTKLGIFRNVPMLPAPLAP
jgi:hypothetical protein